MATADERVGIYISVPFCRAKCSFCNFASGVGTGAAMAAYVRTLAAEITRAREDAARMGAVLPGRADTVYFGGGTPSLLEPAQVREIFRALHGVVEIAGDAEVTLEAAPGQIAPAVLEAFQREGVNRVSLGVQSFVDGECAAVGRLHTGVECLAEIARLRAAGVGDVGADLIAGLPYQTEASWEESLGAAAGAGLTHLSVYMFEVDEDSRLGAEVLRGGGRFHAGAVDEDLAATLYERACAVLPAAGLAQYEISNFAQEGFRSRHNRKYWTRAPYVGFGLDAHSMLRRAAGGDVRFANTDELASYGFAARTLPQVVDQDGAFEETLFLGLRMVDGVDVEGLRGEFGGARVDAVTERVREMVESGLMAHEGARWTLTARGRLVSNEVFGELLAVCA